MNLTGAPALKRSLIVAAALLGIALGGCGQTGSLSLPGPEPMLPQATPSVPGPDAGAPAADGAETDAREDDEDASRNER